MAGRPSRKENRAASSRLKPRKSVAVNVGRARARYAGDQRADLRDLDDQAVEKPHSLERALMPSDQLGKAEQ